MFPGFLIVNKIIFKKISLPHVKQHPCIIVDVLSTISFGGTKSVGHYPQRIGH